MKVEITSNIDEAWETVPADLQRRMIRAAEAFQRELDAPCEVHLQAERMPGYIPTTHASARLQLPYRVAETVLLGEDDPLHQRSKVGWRTMHWSGIIKGHENFLVKVHHSDTPEDTDARPDTP